MRLELWLLPSSKEDRNEIYADFVEIALPLIGFFFLRFFFLFMEFRINEKKRGGKTFPFFHSMEQWFENASKKRFFPSLLTGGENLVRVHSL